MSEKPTRSTAERLKAHFLLRETGISDSVIAEKNRMIPPKARNSSLLLDGSRA